VGRFGWILNPWKSPLCNPARLSKPGAGELPNFLLRGLGGALIFKMARNRPGIVGKRGGKIGRESGWPGIFLRGFRGHGGCVGPGFKDPYPPDAGLRADSRRAIQTYFCEKFRSTLSKRGLS